MISLLGPPLAGVYAATKGAIESFSDSLRREVAHFGISVSLIEPCYVATNLLSAATAETQSALKQTCSDSSDECSGHRKLYAPFYSETIETIIKFCAKCASSPQVTTTAIEVRRSSLSHLILCCSMR
jgi:short-subunit dehydrogenase